ncbi:MAG: hypothetical protein D6736_07475 [Nitrospinota bacterium]|nr:MAG: hypothetical protein D6736_07475 [Nitrospinota bacterium]
MLKRSIDICLALLGLTFFLPLLPLLGLLIKLDSRGPIFYLCDRVGKGGEVFKMYKLRTMYETLVDIGTSVSPAGDPRVTPVGRFLRRTKLNEFPQLFNILKGEMTFVGPRPESPDLAALYPEEAQKIFSVTPGLVGPNQILGRNEEEWYPPDADPQQYYIESILPHKLPLDLEYVEQSSTFKDLKYILLGVKETLFKAISWKFVLQKRSQIYLLLADAGLVILSFVLAHLLRFEGLPEGPYHRFFLQLLPLVVVIRLSCFLYFGLYKTLIRYLSTADIIAVCKAVSLGSFLLVGLSFFLDLRPFSRAVFLIDWLCLILFMSSLRLGLRFLWERRAKKPVNRNQRRVLIFGAGDAGVLAYQSLMAEKGKFDVVGFLDDDPAKRHKMLFGKRVLGDRFNLEAVAKLYRVHEILLAIPSAPPQEVARVVQACQRAGVQFRIFPTLKDTGTPSLFNPSSPERDLAFLLGQEEMGVDMPTIRRLVQGRRVLVAGASSAVGIELCRQLLRFAPQKLIIIDHDEAYLTELLIHLLEEASADQIVPLLCPSGGTEEKSEEIVSTYRPEIVFQLGLRKYPPLFDFQIEHLAWRNSLSTFHLARQAAQNGCQYFVLVSSLEAARRDHPLSASLRTVELSLRLFFAAQQTTLVTVRLCDVLESRGGIVALLEQQIIGRQRLLLPRREIKHPFLSKQGAVRFLLGSLALADTLPSEQAGIFVCTRSKALSLAEIAGRLATLYGLQLEEEIPVEYLPPLEGESSPGTPRSTGEEPPLGSTQNPGIGIMREEPPAEMQEVSRNIQPLFTRPVQDFFNVNWYDHTQHLLLREGTR